MSVRPLTTKQRLFVEAYLASPNATEAARKAGYKGTDNALGVIGHKMLTNAKISAFVEKRVQSFGMTANDVLSELAAIARGDYQDFRSDKVKSLELLGKHFKLFTDKTEVTGKDDGPISLIVVKPKAE